MQVLHSIIYSFRCLGNGYLFSFMLYFDVFYFQQKI